MDYVLDIPEELDKKFSRLSKKDKKQLQIVDKKIQQILKDPYHFKQEAERKGFSHQKKKGS